MGSGVRINRSILAWLRYCNGDSNTWNIYLFRLLYVAVLECVRTCYMQYCWWFQHIILFFVGWITAIHWDWSDILCLRSVNSVAGTARIFFVLWYIGIPCHSILLYLRRTFLSTIVLICYHMYMARTIFRLAHTLYGILVTGIRTPRTRVNKNIYVYKFYRYVTTASL